MGYHVSLRNLEIGAPFKTKCEYKKFGDWGTLYNQLHNIPGGFEKFRDWGTLYNQLNNIPGEFEKFGDWDTLYTVNVLKFRTL